MRAWLTHAERACIQRSPKFRLRRARELPSKRQLPICMRWWSGEQVSCNQVESCNGSVLSSNYKIIAFDVGNG